MKKKLLSLVLAGAMVASTSVSAFAATPIKVGNGEITGADDQEYTTDVTIEGSVANDNGTLPAGTFNVTIPTKATFSVNEDGKLTGTTIKVSNKGKQSIDVYAEQFIDTTRSQGEGITVVAESELEQKDRTFVSLQVYGKSGSVYLKTEDTNNAKGLYKTNKLQEVAADGYLKLISVAAGQEDNLTLTGKAGQDDSNLDEKVVNEGIKDEFTLTLRIKKSDN